MRAARSTHPTNVASLLAEIEHLEQRVRASHRPVDRSAEFERARALRQHGDLSEAAQAYEQAGEDPRYAGEAMGEASRIYLQLGQVRSAITLAKRALHHVVGDSEKTLELMIAIGAAYERLGNLKEAEYYFRRVVRIDPSRTDLLRRLHDPGAGVPTAIAIELPQSRRKD